MVDIWRKIKKVVVRAFDLTQQEFADKLEASEILWQHMKWGVMILVQR